MMLVLLLIFTLTFFITVVLPLFEKIFPGRIFPAAVHSVQCALKITQTLDSPNLIQKSRPVKSISDATLKHFVMSNVL